MSNANWIYVTRSKACRDAGLLEHAHYSFVLTVKLTPPGCRWKMLDQRCWSKNVMVITIPLASQHHITSSTKWAFFPPVLQGRVDSGLGLAWSESAGTGAYRPPGPAGRQQEQRAEGGLGQRVSRTAWETVLQETDSVSSAGQRHGLLPLLLQGCQGCHCRHHCRQRLRLHQGWVR